MSVQEKSYLPEFYRTRILENIQYVLLQERCQEEDYVSLDMIAKLIQATCHQHEYQREFYESQLEYLLSEKYYRPSVSIHEFDHKTKQLKVSCCFSFGDHVLSFSKDKGDLYIAESNSPLYENQIFSLLSSTLSKIYDDYALYDLQKNQIKFGIVPFDAPFLVDISSSQISLYSLQRNFLCQKAFELSVNGYSNQGYRCYCNSEEVVRILKENASKIFQQIFVPIEYCPEWMKERLRDERQQELTYERKMQKRLELKKKVFGWLPQKKEI